MAARSPRFDDVIWSSLPPETEAPELWAWWADALSRWLRSDVVMRRVEQGQGERRDPAGDAALLRDLFKAFEARSRTSLYLVVMSAARTEDPYGVRPFHLGHSWLSPFYPALWEDLRELLTEFRYGLGRRDTEQEDATFPDLDAWLLAEARGELQSPGLRELQALDLLPGSQWPRLIARRDAARRRR